MKKMTEKHRKVAVVCAFAVFLLFFAFLTVFLGKPILSFFRDPELFRGYVEEKGWLARLVFVGMMVLQVIVALIPGEPLEIAAGIAFGSFEGTLLVLAGIAVGSALVFLLVRWLGVKMVEVFFPLEKIHSLKLLQNSKRFHFLLFLVMFIPGTPKDLISYFVGLTDTKMAYWVILATLARVPSVVTSTVGGDALGEENYLIAVIVFAGTALVSILGFVVYDRLIGRKKDK